MPDDPRHRAWRPRERAASEAASPPPERRERATHLLDTGSGRPIRFHLAGVDARRLDRYVPDLVAAGGGLADLSIRSGPADGGGGPTVVLAGPGEEDSTVGLDDLGATVLNRMTLLLLRHEPSWAHVHAAAAVVAGRAVVVPGASGHGKSTLVCHLAAGHGLLNDEIVALDDEAGVVRAAARPVSVKASGRAVVGALAPGVAAPGAGDGLRWVTAPELGAAAAAAAPPGLLLVTDRRPGPLEVAPLAAIDGLHALVANAYDITRDSVDRLRQLSWLAAHSVVLRVRYRDAGEVGSALGPWVARAPTPRPWTVATTTLGGRLAAPLVVATLDGRILVFRPRDRRVVVLGPGAEVPWRALEQGRWDLVSDAFLDELRPTRILLEGRPPCPTP